MKQNSSPPSAGPADRQTAHADYQAAKAQATRLVKMAHRYTYGDYADPRSGAAFAAEAQVYATLAAAAATLAAVPVEDVAVVSPAARATVLGEVVTMLAQEARAYRSTGSRTHAEQAAVLDRMVTRLSRDAVRAVTPDTEPSDDVTRGGAADA